MLGRRPTAASRVMLLMLDLGGLVHIPFRVARFADVLGKHTTKLVS